MLLEENRYRMVGKKIAKNYNPVPTASEEVERNDEIEFADAHNDDGHVDRLQQQEDSGDQSTAKNDGQVAATIEDEESKKLVKEGAHNPFLGEGTDDNNLEITVDDAIERLGMGKFQLLVLVAAGLCFAADAMQVLMLSFLSEVLRLEWDLTTDETAFITSMLFIG